MAFGLYLINLGVGAAAQWAHLRLGWLHHALYFAVFSSAAVALVAWPHPLLCVTLAALCYMPLSRPGTWKHPTAALIGLSGYIASFP